MTDMATTHSIAQAEIEPSTTPRTPPAVQSPTASSRNCRCTSDGRGPTARLRPISGVLSVAQTSIMFMMPIPPTISYTAAIEPSKIVRVRIDSLRARRNSSASPSSGVTPRQGHGAVEPWSLSVKMMQTDSERSKKQRLLNALAEILQGSRTITGGQDPGLLPSEGKREYDS